MNPRDKDYLTHVLEAISAIESYVTGGEAAFMNDRKTQDAVIRNLEIIGEAVTKLSGDFRAAYPEVPWLKISGMRNRLIHGYLTVDLNIVWSTVEQVLPAFKSSIQGILRSGPKS